MERLTFDTAQESDIPDITGVLTNATQYKLAQGDTSWGEGGWLPHEIKERMDDGSTFYLVKIKDEVVGTVSLAWHDDRNWGDRPGDAGYMHQLAVKEGYHGRGIGGQINDWLAEEVAKANKQFLRLDCDAHNAGLCTFYERQGFVRVGTHTRPDNEMGSYEAALYERAIGGQTGLV
jgi:ribosomal protein S18 acetylase RimI-like enzyme